MTGKKKIMKPQADPLSELALFFKPVVIYVLMTLSNYTAYALSIQFHANRSFSMLEPLNTYGSYGFCSLRDKSCKKRPISLFPDEETDI